MSISAGILVRSALQNGVDGAYPSTDYLFSDDFKAMASPTLNEPKGAGLYIWKPFIVWKRMLEIPDGDILIYADSGQTIISSVQPVIDEMYEDIMMFSNGWKHIEWCKADVMKAITGEDAELNDRTQAQASLIFFRVTPETRNFVKEWMLWSLMPGFCDNSPSKLPNISTFQETRWDQSILTCLQIKYGYKLHWFPSSTNWHNKSAHPNDNYPAIVDHHRKRNPGATGGTDSEW